jgi:hypothetical protein
MEVKKQNYPDTYKEKWLTDLISFADFTAHIDEISTKLQCLEMTE